MPLMKIVAPILLACLIFTPFAAGTAYAADEPPTDPAVLAHQLACEDGICSLRVDMGSDTPRWLPTTGLVLSVLESNLHVLPDGAGFSVTDGLALDLPIGNLKLSDAQIDLNMGEDGSVESFYGTARVPTPSLGFFSRATTNNPIATTIGFDYAGALPDINAPLDPERKYLFFDLVAGTELEASLGDESQGSLWLTIPEGQRATVVVDPQERFAFIDGNVTMRYSGTGAFLAQLLDPAETIDVFSGELPIRHQATVHVSGVVAEELADTRLELAGRYAVDGGKVAEWLNFNGEPLALEGGIVISDVGMLGTGIVRSTVLPENVWDSAVQAQVFVPFSTDFRDAYAALNTRVDIPFADVSADGYARLDGALDMVADGSLDVPWRSGDTDAMAATETTAADSEQIAVVEDEVDGPSRWTKVWDVTAEGAQKGLEVAGKPAGAAAGWVKNAAGTGYDSAASGIEWSAGLASNTWCSTTGLCEGGGSAADDVTATAMR